MVDNFVGARPCVDHAIGLTLERGDERGDGLTIRQPRRAKALIRRSLLWPSLREPPAHRSSGGRPRLPALPPVLERLRTLLHDSFCSITPACSGGGPARSDG